jgi:hypothetical protein
MQSSWMSEDFSGLRCLLFHVLRQLRCGFSGVEIGGFTTVAVMEVEEWIARAFNYLERRRNVKEEEEEELS